MRVVQEQDGLTVHAISGSYVVHLAFDVTEERRQGLLGFALHREDRTEGEADWIPNRRTFPGLEQDRSLWPSREAPVQKFRWGDYTAKPRHDYVYTVSPAYGRAGAVELGDPVKITISSEDPERLSHPDGTVHGVHFSRSGAASQAYARRFRNRRPDEVAGDAALKWLSRGLLEAMLAFIDRARAGDELAIAIYEFHYPPILARIKAAAERGVEVKVLYDAGTGKSGPLEKNRSAIRRSGLSANVRPRAGLRSYIFHHKFIVLVRGGKPVAVWTGSTNMSLNGIYAQLNVGHVIEAEDVAAAYLALHRELWTNDPSAKQTRTYLTTTYPRIGLPEAGRSSSFIFSPRSGEEAIELYLQLLRSAQSLVVLTAPFGVDRRIEQFLRTSSATVIKFGLTGQPGKEGGQVTRLDSIDGTHFSMPARIETPLDRWQIEQFGYESHAYIHTKFLLIDPLGADPLLVTGSANFSRASCLNNDENMLVITGHTGVADVYLTEFLRMFEHYAFRQFVLEHRRKRERLPLATSNRWTDSYYRPGSERERDRLLFSGRAVD